MIEQHKHHLKTNDWATQTPLKTNDWATQIPLKTIDWGTQTPLKKLMIEQRKHHSVINF
jgi:hypothetical protein